MEKINQIKNLYDRDQEINEELKELSKSKQSFLKKEVELLEKLNNGRKQASKFMGSKGHLEEMG